MNFTFRNNVWKGEETNVNIVIPTNSRPFHNTDNNLRNINRNPFTANPIKHWRKQISPYYVTKSSKQVSIDQINAPNSSSRTTVSIDCSTDNSQLLTENLIMLAECDGIKHIYYDDTIKIKCTGGKNHIRRSASTSVSKNYYRNHNSYLKSKCKTFKENTLLGQRLSSNSYTSASCVSTKGSDGSDCKKPIIYKNSNNKFSTQGAVSSSTNILRKKNDAIYKNNASLKKSYKNGIISLTNFHDTESSSGYYLNYIKGNVDSSNQCKSSKQCM